MKTNLTVIFILSFCCHAFSQKVEASLKDKLMKELAINACKCVDSISVYDKSKDEIAKDVNKCIDEQVGAYQLGAKLADVGDLKKAGDNGKKTIDINIDMNKDGKDYKAYYYEMERYMMENCASLKTKIAADEKQSRHSVSQNPEAASLYSKGIDESDKEHYKKAIEYFQKALKIDSAFAFAWDNMGVCYRKLEDYDNALYAYKRSLALDPNGVMPLQNIAIVYQYKKEYQHAIEAYEKLAQLDKNNPEVYYGMGQVYAGGLMDMEKGLQNLCKAYNLYVEQKSPYRTDAETMISALYAVMKKDGKEDVFKKILKENGISPDMK